MIPPDENDEQTRYVRANPPVKFTLGGVEFRLVERGRYVGTLGDFQVTLRRPDDEAPWTGMVHLVRHGMSLLLHVSENAADWPLLAGRKMLTYLYSWTRRMVYVVDRKTPFECKG